MPAQDGRRAIVVGGSIAGLATAALLRQRGWQVDVCERSEGRLEGRGAGIVCQPVLLRLLEGLGIDPRRVGIDCFERLAFDSAGQVIGRVALHQIMSPWDKLYRLLRDLLQPDRIQTGHALVGIEQDEHGVRATFANGRRLDGDLLVGADGVRSTVRRQFAPAVQAAYSGYAIWRGIADEAVLPADVRRLLFERFTFHFPPGHGIIGYPIGDGQDDRRGYNWAWYKKADEAEVRDMLTDGSGREHLMGISPALVRPDVIAAMRKTAEATIAPPLLAVLGCIEHPFFGPIVDCLSPRFAFGRVALVGDAAALARPHIGYGTAKAAGDGLALAQALDKEPGTVASALKAYEAARHPVGAECVRRARLFGAWISSDPPAADEREELAELQTTEGLLRHAANGAFLAPLFPGTPV